MAYALKVVGVPASAGMSETIPQQIIPLTGLVDPQLLLHGEGNTIMYEQHPELRELMFELFSTGASPASSATSLRQLLCCLPQLAVPGQRSPTTTSSASSSCSSSTRITSTCAA